MAYKYKLVKELGPRDFKQAAKIAGPDTMDAISKGHLNDYDLNDLEQILGQAGVEQEKIYQIVNLWMNRHKDVSLNEKQEDDFMKKASELAQKGNLDPTPEPKGNTYMTPEEHEERKKQGKKNLTKEVLRRLKNR